MLLSNFILEYDLYSLYTRIFLCSRLGGGSMPIDSNEIAEIRLAIEAYSN
jgi:hypothetical protein